MRISTVLGVVAATFGTGMALSPLLQARVMSTNKSSRDVSIGALWAYAVNCVGWLAYGVSIDNVPMVFPNAIALVSLGVALTFAFRYRIRLAPGGESTAQSAI